MMSAIPQPAPLGATASANPSALSVTNSGTSVLQVTFVVMSSVDGGWMKVPMALKSTFPEFGEG
jgi:hypothetical protein